MIPDTNSRPTIRDLRERRYQALVAFLLVASVIMVPISVGSASAATAIQDNETNETNQTEPAPYYENVSQDDVNNESWTAGHEDATFENITAYASRFGTFIIGSDVNDRNAPTAPLIVGLTLLGAGLGVTVGTGIGIVGGAVLGIVSIFGVSAIGVFPFWFYAVGLFGVGLILSSSFKRVVG